MEIVYCRTEGTESVETSSRPSRILIIEDERHIAKLLDYFLRKAGYEVLCVSSAEEALPLLTSYVPDAVLLDLVLPGMSGLDFLRELRSSPDRSEQVVIVLSAHWFDPEDMTLAQAGATAQCAKPVAPTTLMRKLQELGIDPIHAARPNL
jgi:two-component system, OmpR family, phosphate regulon response regulator PhoB